MSDAGKYVADDFTAERRDAQYILTVLACLANYVNGKQSYPSVSDAKYAVQEAQERARRLLTSLEERDDA